MANICPRKKTPESPIMKEKFTIIKFLKTNTNMLNTYCIKNPNYKEYKCKCLPKINQLDFVTGQQFYSILRYLIQTYITNYM